ncbi:hypothetical protein HDV05_007391 [Chytridiales sp. JEL 0842]|nr:hypothetical protein HDV05_007391 [Chytridiales sp. JEL 0842]
MNHQSSLRTSQLSVQIQTIDDAVSEIQHNLERLPHFAGGDDSDEFERDETADFIDNHQEFLQKLKTFAFSILFSIVHGRKNSKLFDYLLMIVEDLQLFAFVLTFEIGDIYALPPGLSRIVSMDYGNMDISQYRVIFWLAAGAVFLMLVNIGVIAAGLLRGRQTSTWPTFMLRFFAAILPSVFFTPILQVLVSALTCNLVSPAQTAFQHATRVGITRSPIGPTLLDSVACTNPRRAPLVAVAAVVLTFYVPISALIVAVFFDPNPTLKGPSNKSHGRVDLAYLFLKLFLVLIYKFVGRQYYLVKTAAAAFTFLAMFALTVFYLPYFNLKINQMRSGFYMAASLTGLASFFSAVAYSATGAPRGYETLGFIIVLMTLGFAAGFKVCGMIYAWIQSTVDGKLTSLKPVSLLGDDEQEQLVFFVWPHVEVAARKLTENMDERRRRFNKAKGAKLKEIFSRGLLEFLDEFAEFQRMDRDAKLNHYLAIQVMRSMWRLVEDRNFKLEDISNFSTQLCYHADRAQNAYAALAAKFPRSKPILRFYARFCYDVTNDFIRGEQLTSLADELENYNGTLLLEPGASMDENLVLDRSLEQRNGSSMRPRITSTTGNDEKPPTEKGDGASSVGRSETSQGSQRRRNAAISKRMRDAKISQRSIVIRVMFVLKTLVLIALAIANFLVVSDLLDGAIFSLAKVGWYNDRSYYTAISFRRVRQLQAAKAVDTFKEVQGRLMEEVTNFSSSSHDLFMYRAESNKEMNDFDTIPTVTCQVSNYPLMNGSRPFNMSLYFFTQGFVSAAYQVANMSMDAFANDIDIPPLAIWKVLDNNDFAQKPYKDALQGLFLPYEWARSQSARIIVFALTGLMLAVKIMLVLVVDIMFLRFQKQQVLTLDIFRSIPTDYIKSALEGLEEVDNLEVFSPTITKLADSRELNKRFYGNHIIFRCMLYFSALAMTSLLLSFAFINLNTFEQIGQNFGHISQASDLREDGVRAYVAAHDLRNFDPLTWVVSTHMDLAAAAVNGLNPDSQRLEFLDKTLEPYFLDGWEMVKLRLQSYVAGLVIFRSQVNNVILTLQLLLVLSAFGAQTILVYRIMEHYRFTNDYIYGILFKLPSHVKRIPAIEAALKAGGFHSELISSKVTSSQNK